MSGSNLALSFRTLVALSNADGLVRDSYQRDRRSLLTLITRRLRRSVNAESCSLFVVPDKNAATVELVASVTDVADDRFDLNASGASAQVFQDPFGVVHRRLDPTKVGRR